MIFSVVSVTAVYSKWREGWMHNVTLSAEVGEGGRSGLPTLDTRSGCSPQ